MPQERAVEIDANAGEAWFNLALAAESLGAPSRAKEAWTKYLTLDSSSGWADEARRHMESLNRQKRSEIWQQRERSKLQGALNRLDRDALVLVVSEFTEEARQFLDDELLLAWATAQSNGHFPDASTTSVVQAAMLADVLLTIGGDRMPVDAVRAIKDTAARHRARSVRDGRRNPRAR